VSLPVTVTGPRSLVVEVGVRDGEIEFVFDAASAARSSPADRLRQA
jgi:hypothetical protein